MLRQQPCSRLPQHELLQGGLFLSNLDFEGVSALASLLNTVIELWFLTVAGNIAKGCVVVRDCGFDNYVLLHCRAIYLGEGAWVKELANTNFMFSYFPHWVIAEWVIPPKCSKFDFIQNADWLVSSPVFQSHDLACGIHHPSDEITQHR